VATQIPYQTQPEQQLPSQQYQIPLYSFNTGASDENVTTVATSFGSLEEDRDLRMDPPRFTNTEGSPAPRVALSGVASSTPTQLSEVLVSGMTAPSFPLPDTTPSATARPTRAYVVRGLACRRNKTRCEPGSDTTKCMRCEVANRDCVGYMESSHTMRKRVSVSA